MEGCFTVFFVIVVLPIAITRYLQELKKERNLEEIKRQKEIEDLRMREETSFVLENICKTKGELVPILQQQFLVQPCFRCNEYAMQLLGVSPNGRSIHYQCIHCLKKMRASAGTQAALRSVQLWITLCELLKKGEILDFRFSRIHDCSVFFEAPAAPLPFEQTTRTPIPEAMRSEVWRRDGGRCVQCDSKQNLQFDHIIPITRGGATSVANLQLLCQPCNGGKTNRI
ncbi:MAG TPA: HNH endonuclease [Urbifossiella sp.]|nr:HNH endonuclease [Urbifossiella sp.]